MNNETAGWHGESPQFHCGEDVNGPAGNVRNPIEWHNIKRRC